MKNPLADSVKIFLSRSNVAAAVMDKHFNLLWHNEEYGKRYKEFSDISGLIANFPEIKPDIIKTLMYECDCHSVSEGNITLLKSDVERFGVIILSIITIEHNPKDEGTHMDLYQKFFHSFRRPCIVFDYPTGLVTNINEAFIHMCGIPEEHLRNTTVSNLFYDGNNTIKRYLASGSPYLKPFIINFTSIDGYDKLLEIFPSLVKDDRNSVIFEMEDITPAVRSQVSDVKDSFRYSFLYKNISDSIIIWKNNKIADINSAARKMWGYNKKDLIGKDISILFINETETIENLLSCSDGEVKETDFKGVKKSGEIFEGRRVTKIFESNKQKLFITVVTDLTEHNKFIKFENERKSFEESILNSQRNIVMVFDDDNNLVRCNNAFMDFFLCRTIKEFQMKYGSVEKLFKNESEHSFITSAYGKEWFKYVADNSRTEYKVIIQNQADNEEHIFFISSSALTFGTGSYVVTLSDITETVQTALALKDANSLLLMYSDNVKSEMETNLEVLTQQTKLAMMGEMIGIITHQWKQPLNAIGLIAQNLEDILEEDESIDKEEIADMMCSIMRHVKSMGETVDNFRDFFKNNNLAKWFNLSQSIDSALMLLQPLLSKNLIKVNTSFCEKVESIFLNGFPNEFKQVVMNIIVNAKDAIGDKISKGLGTSGSGEVWIEISQPTKETVKIAIRDNGVGLSQENIDKIFDMQYTTKGDSGTGVGMYMSHMIIEKMEGKIYAENWEKGASIIMNLPVRPDA